MGNPHRSHEPNPNLATEVVVEDTVELLGLGDEGEVASVIIGKDAAGIREPLDALVWRRLVRLHPNCHKNCHKLDGYVGNQTKVSHP